MLWIILRAGKELWPRGQNSIVCVYLIIVLYFITRFKTKVQSVSRAKHKWGVLEGQCFCCWDREENRWRFVSGARKQWIRGTYKYAWFVIPSFFFFSLLKCSGHISFSCNIWSYFTCHIYRSCDINVRENYLFTIQIILNCHYINGRENYFLRPN